MSSLFRNVFLQWHRLLNTKIITLDGVLISTDQRTIPRSVRSMLFKNVYEGHERELVKTHLKYGDRVLEIGTGIGLISLVANKICGSGNVRSYEANPDMEPIILNNFALNSFEPDLYMNAITKDGSDIEFFKHSEILSSSSIDRNIGAVKCVVPSVSLESVLQSYGPDFIVMDIEGEEAELLIDTKLEGVRGVIVELHPHIVGQEKLDAINDNLVKIGFKIVDVIDRNVAYIRQ